MRAALYTRISRDTEHDGLGVDRQERECRALAEQHELDVVATFSDNDISAFKGRARPGFAAAQEAMKAGEFDVLVAWHPDRLTRQTRELEDLIDLLDATKVDVLTVSAGKYDLRTPSGRMAARIVGSVARYESEHKGERQRSKMDELARRGMPAGGRTPYGYRWEHPEQTRGKGRLLVHAEEAKTLRWMAEQVLDGRSTVAIQRDLNERGVPTKEGRPWHHSTVRAVLVNPAVAGLRVHRREIAGIAAWEPIFGRGEWEQIVATVADPARKRTRPARKYVLAGLVQSEAGDPMNGSPDIRAVSHGGGRKRVIERGPDGKPLYQTVGRTYTTRTGAKTPTTIDADKLEPFVVAQVLIALENWQPEPAPPDDDGASDVAAIEAELEELAALRGNKVISMREWMKAREPLVAALDEAKKMARRPRPLPALLGSANIVDAWNNPDVTLDQKRQAIATIVEKVVVSRSKRGRWSTMEERVSVVWRR